MSPRNDSPPACWWCFSDRLVSSIVVTARALDGAHALRDAGIISNIPALPSGAAADVHGTAITSACWRCERPRAARTLPFGTSKPTRLAGSGDETDREAVSVMVRRPGLVLPVRVPTSELVARRTKSEVIATSTFARRARRRNAVRVSPGDEPGRVLREMKALKSMEPQERQRHETGP